MIKCPSCSHDNVDGTTFCEMCGEELQAAPAVDVGAAASTPAASGSGDIKCPACENLNPPDNVVCEVCGTELHPAGSAPATPGASTSQSTPATAVPHDTPASATSPAATATPPSDVLPPDALPPAADTSVVATSDGGVSVDAATSTPVTTDTPADTDSADAAAAVTDDSAPATGAANTQSSTPQTTPAAPGAGLKPGQIKLVVEQGMNVGKQFVLGDAEMQVGREDEEEEIYPDIDLADQDEGYVHRKHATLKFENDQLFVTHLGGANKTRLNNKPIPDNEPQAVKLGDKLAFGKVVTRVMPHA